MPILSRPQLEDTIYKAMKHKAPAMFRELQEEGGLKEEIRDIADQIMDAYRQMNDNIIMDVERKKAAGEFKNPWEAVQDHTMRSNMAWEIALAEGLEFPTEDEEVNQEEIKAFMDWMDKNTK